MNTTHYDGGFWPTRQQELLLRAALLQGKESVDAWCEWKSSVDVDQLDSSSLRLLPLLYRNLRTHGVEDSLMKKMKGVYRFTWYKNQTRFHNMAILLRRFHNAGIQTMILKGAALTLLYYMNYGLRPMGDFDVLIHTKKAPVAINLLTELGWKSLVISRKALTETYISVKKGHRFNDAAGQGFDLHWHLLKECCYLNADDDFWHGAILTRLHNVPVYALNPTDQLLHVCLHGAQWDSVLPFRWVADAMMILKTSQPEIDWHRFITHAQKRRLILPLKATLHYLRDVFDASIPLTVLQSMQGMPVSIVEHIEYRARTHPAKLLRPFYALCVRYLYYSRGVRGAGLLHRLIGFAKLPQVILGLDHLWQVPFSAVFKALFKGM